MVWVSTALAVGKDSIVTVVGPGCTLGGITVIGGITIGAPASIASNLLALWASAVMGKERVGPLPSSATEMTRKVCAARVVLSTTHTASGSGTVEKPGEATLIT